MSPPNTKLEQTDTVGAIFDDTWEAPADTHYRWHIRKRKTVEAKHGTKSVVDDTFDTASPLLLDEETTHYADSKYPTFCCIVDSTVRKTWDELYVSAPEILEKHQALVKRELPQRAKVLSKLKSVQHQGIDGDILSALFISLPHQSNKSISRKTAELSEEDDANYASEDLRVKETFFKTPTGSCIRTDDADFCSTSGVEIHISPDTNPKPIISPAATSSDVLSTPSVKQEALNMNFPHPIHLFNCRFISTILNPMCIKLGTIWWWDKHEWMRKLVGNAGHLALSQPKSRKTAAKKLPKSCK